MGRRSATFSHSALVPESLTISCARLRFHPHCNWPNDSSFYAGRYMTRKAGVSQAASLLPVTAGFVMICAAIVAIRGGGFERVCGTAMAIGSAVILGGYLLFRFGNDNR